MRSLPTASALERAFHCLGSAVLPQVDETSPYAAHGTAVHSYLEACNVLGREGALAAVEDDAMRTVCAEIDLTDLPVDPASYTSEMTFAVDTVTGEARVLGKGLGRDYSSATPTEMVGTCDVVALLGGDRVFVADYKTGHADLPAPAQNRQMRCLGLAAARAYGRSGAVVELIRLREDGTAWRQRGELDAFDLAEVAAELCDLAARIVALGSDTPPLSVGAHCRGCHSVSYCPAQTTLLRALVVAPEEHVEGMVRQLTQEQAPVAYAQLRALEGLVERMGEQLKAYARQHPIALPDGKVYEEVTVPRTTLVGSAVWHLLRERLGEEAAWAAVKITATQEAVKDVAARLALESGRKKTHVAAELLETLRERGGVKVHEHRSFRVGKAKEAP